MTVGQPLPTNQRSYPVFSFGSCGTLITNHGTHRRCAAPWTCWLEGNSIGVQSCFVFSMSFTTTFFLEANGSHLTLRSVWWIMMSPVRLIRHEKDKLDPIRSTTHLCVDHGTHPCSALVNYTSLGTLVRYDPGPVVGAVGCSCRCTTAEPCASSGRRCYGTATGRFRWGAARCEGMNHEG